MTFNNMATMLPWFSKLVAEDRDLLGKTGGPTAFEPIARRSIRTCATTTSRVCPGDGLPAKTSSFPNCSTVDVGGSVDRLEGTRRESKLMKIIALEEHFATSEVIAAWASLAPEVQDIATRKLAGSDIERRLLELADVRIAAMDEAGVDVQVLSFTTPGVQNLDPDKSVILAPCGQ